ncbi:protein Wnt-1-like [Hydractinia symbiolongicarpus]|uniref:protein Wnt-1-like n=1 Tax=Hydractinia symbiolongicarpus TaxID=13093 RepID=UPI002550579F|nr:protein Wnt-1-like [Hydractinia symbiolongicarpus]
MKFYKVFILFFFCVYTKTSLVNGEESYWWRVAVSPHVLNQNGYHAQYLKHHPSQRGLIKKVVHTSTSECQRLFKYNRWNCKSTNPLKPFGDIVDIGCRETAFIYALTSASLTYHVIRECSQGRIYGCYNRCVKPENVKLQHTRLLNSTHIKNEACDDNIKFGVNVWKDFVFKGEKSSDIRAIFNVRNSQLGLQEVYKSAGLVCRCHGVSGSCVVKICSEKIPNNFRKISTPIYQKYTEAHFNPLNQKIVEQNSKQIVRLREIINRKKAKTRLPSRRKRGYIADVKQLEFYDFSPDYCRKSRYSAGIKHRACPRYVSADQYKAGVRSCDDLCCYGRGAKRVERIVRSNCRFVYCCEVNCKERKEMVDEYFCV